MTASAVGTNAAPVISSSPLLAATVGRDYRYQLAGSDSDSDSLIWSLGNAPTGMSIDAYSGNRVLPARLQFCFWRPATGGGSTAGAGRHLAAGFSQRG